MSQTATATRPVSSDGPLKITYEEFLERYSGIRAEWIDGVVELMSPVSNVHQRIGNFLFRVLAEFVEVYDLGELFQAEFQMKLSGLRRGREPDILFVAKAKLAQLRLNHYDGPADLVVEIISPESIKRDRVTKFAEYQRAGVLEYWLIDPPTQQADFFQRDAAGHFQSVLPDEEGIYRSMALPEFWLRVAWLWQSPPAALDHCARRIEFALKRWFFHAEI